MSFFSEIKGKVNGWHYLRPVFVAAPRPLPDLAPVITVEMRSIGGTKEGKALMLCVDGVPVPGQGASILSQSCEAGATFTTTIVLGEKVRLVYPITHATSPKDLA